MAVPSWVYDDKLTDEEKLELFRKDMKGQVIAGLCGIAAFPILYLLAQIFGWK